MGGFNLLEGRNLLVLAMNAGSQTKPGDDLSKFVPGLGVQPYPTKSLEPPMPQEPPEGPPTLRAAVMPIRLFSPLERALRDLEDSVFGSGS